MSITPISNNVYNFFASTKYVNEYELQCAFEKHVIAAKNSNNAKVNERVFGLMVYS